MKETEPNTWKFEYTDMEGTVRTVAFQSDIWVDAAEHLIKFLRGAGFDVDHSSLALNRSRHPYVETYYFEDYYPEPEEDAGFPFTLPCFEAQDNNPGCTD